MNLCARIATDCTGHPDRVRRLASIREPVRLCGACEQAARRMGMDPQPVPEWMVRGLIKDFTGAVA